MLVHVKIFKICLCHPWATSKKNRNPIAFCTAQRRWLNQGQPEYPSSIIPHWHVNMMFNFTFIALSLLSPSSTIAKFTLFSTLCLNSINILYMFSMSQEHPKKISLGQYATMSKPNYKGLLKTKKNKHRIEKKEIINMHHHNYQWLKTDWHHHYKTFQNHQIMTSPASF